MVVKRAKTKFTGKLEAVDGTRVFTEGQVSIYSRDGIAGYHLVFRGVSEGAFALNETAGLGLSATEGINYFMMGQSAIQ